MKRHEYVLMGIILLLCVGMLAWQWYDLIKAVGWYSAFFEPSVVKQYWLTNPGWW